MEMRLRCLSILLIAGLFALLLGCSLERPVPPERAIREFSLGVCDNVAKGSTVYFAGIHPDSLFLGDASRSLSLRLESELTNTCPGRFKLMDVEKERIGAPMGSGGVFIVMGRLGKTGKKWKDGSSIYYISLKLLDAQKKTIVLATYKEVLGIRESSPSGNVDELKKRVAEGADEAAEAISKALEQGKKKVEEMRKWLEDVLKSR